MSLKCPKTGLFYIAFGNVFGHFRPTFGEKIDPKYPRGNFLSKRIHKKNQLKIPIFSKSDDGVTW